jgi:hypothetical protein
MDETLVLSTKESQPYAVVLWKRDTARPMIASV